MKEIDTFFKVIKFCSEYLSLLEGHWLIADCQDSYSSVSQNLGSKSQLKASFETTVPVKEICPLLVDVMFQCMLFPLQNTKEVWVFNSNYSI